MLLWIAFALLTAGVLAFVLAPLVRPQRADAGFAADPESTIAVYRDQLRELEADKARGLIDPAEAAAAEREISRRVLAAVPPAQGAPVAATSRSPRTTAALAAALAVPLVAITLYIAFGAPGAIPTAAQREAAREQATVARLVTQVEARLRAVPGDGKGWEVIAPVYLRLGRFQDAAFAYAQAARLQGESVPLLAGLAESSMLAAGGAVTDEARVAYEKLLKLEPSRVEPRFWLAMAKEQAGDLDTALKEYKTLLAAAPAGAPYRASLEQRIHMLSSMIAARDAGPASGPPAGPSAADIAAASKLDPAQREAMVKQMVDGLAQRLKTNGNDLPGWLRLVRAYAVLDRKDDARAALAEARRNFASDAAALGELTRLAASLGLGS